MRSLFFILLFCISTSSYAQFELIGDAEYMTGNCIRLTPDYQYREGIAYYQAKLDLTRFFEITFDIFFGAKDEGADGITFVIHDDARGYGAYGTWGECMGYGRWSPSAYWANSITPSIAVEFDTYQNLQQGDPGHDHIAYLENGVSFHEKYWSNEQDDFNLEDDILHDFRFSWDPETQIIKVKLDGKTVYTGQRDLIKDIFKGKTEVIWGFTASTGRKSNLQYFCLRNLAYQAPSEKSTPIDQNPTLKTSKTE